MTNYNGEHKGLGAKSMAVFTYTEKKVLQFEIFTLLWDSVEVAYRGPQ